MGPSRALGSVARGAGNNGLPPGGGRTWIEARRVWESLIAALAGDCHSVDKVFKLLVVSWPDAKNWSTFCESRLLVRALAACSARGWLAGSVLGHHSLPQAAQGIG